MPILKTNKTNSVFHNLSLRNVWMNASFFKQILSKIALIIVSLCCFEAIANDQELSSKKVSEDASAATLKFKDEKKFKEENEPNLKQDVGESKINSQAGANSKAKGASHGEYDVKEGIGKTASEPKGAKPIVDSSLSLVPVLDIDTGLQNQLDRQFQQIQTLLETENAFSEKLGENYYSYGKLLLQVAKADDAKEAFINALHIAKVNNGVEGIEQRPILRELFEISYAQKNIKEADSIAKKIVFIERKRKVNDDIYSFDIIVRLGHLHMDNYLKNPVDGQEGLVMINKAMTYFQYAYNRYGNQQMSDLMLPYGEIAFLWYLKTLINLNAIQTAQARADTFNSLANFERRSRNDNFSNINNSRLAVSPKRAKINSLKILSSYYKKAKKENDIENAVLALLNAGDINILFGSHNDARTSYLEAWNLAQKLPVEHPIVKSFEEAKRLPNFQYALVDPFKDLSKEYDEVPLKLTIDINGKVRRVDHNLDVKKYNSRVLNARRIAKRLKFRPVFENGKPLRRSVVDYTLQLPSKNKKKSST